jgi:hypothetical protein
VELSNIYGLLVFVATLGVIQAAAAYNNLRCLFFFRNRILSYIFGVIAAGVPLGFFFRWNYMYDIGIIAGVQQTGLYIQSVVAAIVFTVILSSLTNIGYRSPQHHSAPPAGLDALREKTYLHLIWERLIGKK